MLDSPYTVSWSPIAVAAAKARLKQSTKPIGATSISETLKAIDARLRHDPIHFGEITRSRGSVEEHLAVHGPVAINFAVDTNKNFVYVRDCHFLSGPSTK